MSNAWPQLDYLSWRDTCSAVHLYLQIAGKYRLAHTPWLNHSWNATFYVSPRGLTSSLIPDGPGVEIQFDFHDREVSSAGFWPGGGGIDYPAFYAYAYPEPKGFRGATVQPDAAFWQDDLGKFVLPYDAVQASADPAATLMAFLKSTYQATAELGGWERDLLECGPGQRGQARPHDAGEKRVGTTSDDEPVERELTGAKGRYRVVIDGVEAEMTYSRVSDSMMIIDHTEVPNALRGRKVGERLVKQAVEDARREGVSIIPLCPFAKALIGRHPEWHDVVAESRASR